ncbi:hypothetical protein [Candidatus Solirubrobacter pratensis]|uniref:hypothetical protein n=1 Tax=Candidatus Solirubrobacter pratensis TaxID=1298857 RepID=UPI00048435FA|nr:hypothetical protein [Candidatus Solirubrobacter pratensis]
MRADQHDGAPNIDGEAVAGAAQLLSATASCSLPLGGRMVARAVGRRALRLVLAAAVGLMLMLPGSLAASTIDFEHPAAGTALTNQYADSGGPAQFDPRITSMQITQGTQIPYLPSRSDSPVPYSQIEQAAQPGTQQAAAHFEAGRWTVVRVYADLRFGPPEGVPVPAVLFGFKIVGPGHRVPLPGNPILPTYSPPRLTPGPDQASTDEEGSDTAAYEFTVPSSWTHGRIELSARLLPAQSIPVATEGASRAAAPGQGGLPVDVPCTTQECDLNDTMGITDIPFADVGSVRIRPLALTVTGDSTFPAPNTAFGWARNLTPVHLLIEPYDTTIDVSDLAGKPRKDALNTMNDRVGTYVCDHGGLPDALIIGVSRNILQGMGNVVATWCWGFPISGTYRYAVVDASFPAYSVPHELHHLLGRGHASAACGGADNDTFLNLGLAINNHESWPLDDVGFIQSVGLAPESSGPLATSPYHVIFGMPPSPARSGCEGKSGKPCPTMATTDWFDFMSYCGSTSFGTAPLISNVWISTHNWNAAIDDGASLASANTSRVVVPRVRAPGRSTSSLYVTGSVGGDGAVTITSVHPVTARLQTPPGRSDYALSGLGSTGTTHATLRMFESFAHVDGPALEHRLEGVVPAAGVAEVEIVKGATVLARRRQSPHAPTVRLGARPTFGIKNAVVRWSAHDADNDHVEAKISYSGDDGRTWKLVWVGPNRGRVRLPAQYLFSARRARIRVEVNDGFRTAIAVSRRFRSPGEAPLVSIALPARRFHEANDAPLLLSGQAFDDRSRQLTGRRLRWMLGRRLLGTGAQITVTGLPAGRDRIDLLARDRGGRVGRASAVVRLGASRPLFLKLRTPRSVRRGARSLRITVSSSASAILIVQAPGLRPQRFSVDRRARGLRPRIRAGRKAVRLRLVLAAGGKRNAQALVVGRRR